MTTKAKVIERGSSVELDGIVTTDHPRSNYGLPVVLVGDRLLNPNDDPGVYVYGDHPVDSIYPADHSEVVQSLRRAGFRIVGQF